ncbi:unnamed protein product [Rhodiola kirilowii]
MERDTLIQQQPSFSSSFSSSLINRLYVAHFLARWDSRMWEFSVGLYMINIWPESLLLTAVYGVVETSSTALFGPMIGQLVDRFTYMKVLRLWLVTQNISFIVAGGTVVGLLVYSSLKYTNLAAFISLVVLTNVFGAVSILSTLAGTILIEREWVVIISEDHPPETQTKMNSVIRRIDLTCKLFAPVVAGFIISFISLQASALTLASWNTISVWLQYWLFSSVYSGIPALHERSLRKTTSRRSIADPEEGTYSYRHMPCFDSQDGRGNSTPSLSMKDMIIKQISEFPCISPWKVYLSQDVVLPGVALALLYYTVLSFGTLMTATLTWEGVPVYIIGLARGVSATIGILATFLYPIIHSHIQTLRTGLWSIWFQWTFLLVCIASILVKSSKLAAYMLMGGVAMSRLGLWMFDLSVVQLMQDHVPDTDRCVVGGVQDSLQSILYLLTFVTGIVIPDPKEFWKLTLLSFLFATLAAILYTLHIYRVRKHLIHFEKFYALAQWLVRLR